MHANVSPRNLLFALELQHTAAHQRISANKGCSRLAYVIASWFSSCSTVGLSGTTSQHAQLDLVEHVACTNTFRLIKTAFVVHAKLQLREGGTIFRQA